MHFMQCGRSGIFILYPGVFHPGSRITDTSTTKGGGEKIKLFVLKSSGPDPDRSIRNDTLVRGTDQDPDTSFIK
jgi:hypothetical protein